MKNLNSIIIIDVFISLLLCGCFGSVPQKESTIKKDQVLELTVALPFVQIGNQKWTEFNLNVSTFRNGDSIPEAKTSEEWQKAGIDKQPSWCYYENDSNYGSRYGKMYNWYAVNDPRGLAPQGWHIPNREEWGILVQYCGGYKVAGTKIKTKEGWDQDRKSVV